MREAAETMDAESIPADNTDTIRNKNLPAEAGRFFYLCMVFSAVHILTNLRKRSSMEKQNDRG